VSHREGKEVGGCQKIWVCKRRRWVFREGDDFWVFVALMYKKVVKLEKEMYGDG